MAINNALTNNEIKNASAVEVEFNRLTTGPGRTTVFSQVGESPSLPHRLTVSHSESGAGIKTRRRSLVRFDKTVMSTVDATVPVTVSAYAVLDAPVGALTASTELSNVLAELMSFLATTGVATTVLFDCTGTGAAALKDGAL